MKKKMKKSSAGVGPALIMAGVLVAVMNVAVMNAHAIHVYCSKAVFGNHKTVINSQSVAKN